uniref:Integral membrane protein 2 n=1 Tax=Hucho hucho TaxID=62062 RepID=A0A4W5K0B8_9TELE
MGGSCPPWYFRLWRYHNGRDWEGGAQLAQHRKCVLTLLGLAFVLTGAIVGAACLYRYYTPKVLNPLDGLCFSEVSSGVAVERQPYYLPRVEEEVEISDNIATIKVPPPRFAQGDPAYILHDFQKLTAYLDLTLRTCFVIPLNTSVVLPPQDLMDLFMQLMVRTNLYYLVQEDLVVTERVDDVTEMGFYIRRLCEGKDTYRMQRRSDLTGGCVSVTAV